MVNRVRMVDIIWFNERKIPNSFFEEEHTTDIQNSVTKFCDLQDYHAQFVIVAPANREEQFRKIMERTAFKDVKARVRFCDYAPNQQYTLMSSLKQLFL